MKTTSRLLITCPKGVELVLEDELVQMGLASIKQTVGGIFCEATLEQTYHICLWSRFANKVIWILAEKTVKNNDEFYKAVRDIAWGSCFSISKSFAVDFKGTNRFIKHSNFGGLLLKDAVVDTFKAELGERPNVVPKNPDVKIYAQIKRDFFLFGIDMSAGSLHRRGYRLAGAMAPLKENLAAALVKRAGVNSGDERLFVDPMCGSGTLLIEAAMIKLNIAPGLERPKFGFENLLKHQRPMWENLKQQAQDVRDKNIAAAKGEYLAIGYDRDNRVIEAAKENVERAGLADLILFKPQSLIDFAPDANIDKALLLTNPPYGERLDQRDELFAVYQLLGKKIRDHCQGWQAAVLSSDDFLLKALSLQKSKKYQFYNGVLKTEWLLFDIHKKETSATAAVAKQDQPKPEVKAADVWQQASEKMADKRQQKTEADSEQVVPEQVMPEVDDKSERFLQGVQMVANRLRKNQKRLKKWLNKNEIHAYRIYDADMPEYAFSLDCYGGQYQVTEYMAPKTVDQFAAYQRKQQFEQAVCEVYNLTRRQLVVKERKPQKGSKQYEKTGDSNHFFRVTEGQGQFYINLHDYLDTGLFLDHRPIRKKIAEMAKGTRFLNLFAYTSAATVHAALGGAKSSVSVDMSQTYQDWSARNFKTNKLSLKAHQLVRADCLTWLKLAKHETAKFDLIFLDPPSFSNSKRMSDTLDVQRDHVEIINDAMALLSESGLLIFSNNLRGFKIDEGLSEKYVMENVTRQSIDMDFERHKKIHQCWYIRHIL
ncbi:MAG: bifunctional 23S rRNA (guanine(2069)-N(7))-methyltransferase RlmK/23S rRNA (guanine(2445)-N(2))-methyltransferase RlmL [Pseudomonadales bacterium]|nr:bifunctional 23S rRNA (guanine(2069)-N(7))-methyltransferase RlmK/23S rRNA (guanine(2445)-N(2))-methyltransferase RlmL [Pseudomonadales bacterium]